jgi:hypothetical protein
MIYIFSWKSADDSEAIYSSEKTVDCQGTAAHYIPEDKTLYSVILDIKQLWIPVCFNLRLFFMNHNCWNTKVHKFMGDILRKLQYFVSGRNMILNSGL